MGTKGNLVLYLDKDLVAKSKSLGFNHEDAQVYAFLATEGPKKAKDIAEELSLYSSQIYHILKRLQINGAIDVTSEPPARFSAVIFEKVLDLLVEARREQYRALQASKK